MSVHHLVAEANGVHQRPHHSLRSGHLYQREIDDAAKLAEELRSLLVSFNEIRPHGALGQPPPLAVHLAGPHLFRRRISKSAVTGTPVLASAERSERGRPPRRSSAAPAGAAPASSVGTNRRRARASPRPQITGTSMAAPEGSLVQLAPTAPTVTAPIATISEMPRRWPSKTKPATAAIAGSMQIRTP